MCLSRVEVAVGEGPLAGDAGGTVESEGPLACPGAVDLWGWAR